MLASCSAAHDVTVWLSTYAMKNVFFWLFLALGVALIVWQWQQNRSARLAEHRVAEAAQAAERAASAYEAPDRD
jgi:protein-S-isoprenylcysteine O-methyltransferase Ste14